MELSAILSRLWRLRLISALVVVIAVVAAVLTTYDVSGSGLKKKRSAVQFGAAESQFYVDTRRPTLVTSQAQATDLIARASILGQFVSSGVVRDRIGKELGIPAASISVQGPTSAKSVQAGVEPVAQQRANQLISENSAFSLVVDVDDTSPTITLYAQAPNAQLASRLAAGVPTALSAYLDSLTRQALPAERSRLAVGSSLETTPAQQRRGAFHREGQLDDVLAGRSVIRTLGPPVAGSIASQSSKALSGLVLIAVLLGGWLAVVLLSVALDRRQANRAPS